MANAVAMQPVRRPLRAVRIKNEDGPVVNVQRIMQGPAYQEKERRVRQPGMPQGAVVGLARATWSWFALSKSLPCGRKRKVAVSRTCNLQRGRRLGASACCWRWKAGGGGIASGKTALKALLLLLLLMPTQHHAHRTTTHGPFADEQLDFSIGSLAKDDEHFPLYYKVLHPFSPR
jgi:hypothetical protein